RGATHVGHGAQDHGPLRTAGRPGDRGGGPRPGYEVGGLRPSGAHRLRYQPGSAGRPPDRAGLPGRLHGVEGSRADTVADADTVTHSQPDSHTDAAADTHPDTHASTDALAIAIGPRRRRLPL